MEFPEHSGSHAHSVTGDDLNWSRPSGMKDSDLGHDDVVDSMPKHIMEAATTDDMSAPAMLHASDHLAGDVISLDTMRDNMRGAIVANFEPDDLDVPAFLRKRNDVM